MLNDSPKEGIFYERLADSRAGTVSKRVSPKRPILFQRGSRGQSRRAAQGDGRGRGPARNTAARSRRQRSGDRDDGAGLGGHRKRRLKEAPVSPPDSMARVIKRVAAKRDLTDHFVFLGDNASVDVARRFLHACFSFSSCSVRSSRQRGYRSTLAGSSKSGCAYFKSCLSANRAQSV